MASMMTAWGYEVEDELAPLLDAETFEVMTGGKYVGDSRVEYALAAASQAVRNACGWHISPSMSCTANVTASGRMVKLPANYVSDVASVGDLESFEWSRKGVIVADCLPRGLDGVAVAYTAGYDAEAVPDLTMTIAGIVEGVMAVAPGVASESADGVSISYSATASSVANSLTSQQMAALAPYKLVSSHAA